MNRFLILTALCMIASSVAHAEARISNPQYFVHFYESANKGGRVVKMNVTADGRAQANDEFEKYGMEGQISEIRFCLPKNRKLVLYSGRFFTEKGYWKFGIELDAKKDPPLRMGPRRHYKSSKEFEGTNKVKIVRLDHFDYDNEVRSAKVEEVEKKRIRK